ncbi:acid-sensing ion channel 1A-like [Patella vulgata]|uniref:acid-sensing ion channel 1A-like n=1 Tax=Patella vulgata TaxID=6465 RepID=UPI00218031D5|nr:acid-sensing ion channel 1A-like [Patella vulgata]
MVGTLTYTTCTFYMKYMEYDFKTKASVRYQRKLEFPAVTICNLHPLDENDFNKSDPILFDRENLNKSDPLLLDGENIDKLNPLLLEYLEQLLSSPPTLNASDSKWELFRPKVSDLNKLGFRFDDMILEVYLNGQLLLKPESQFSVSFRGPIEKCFTFNDRYYNETHHHKPLMFQANDIMALVLDTKQDRYAFASLTAGVRLILHRPDEPFHTLSPSIRLSPGYYHQIKVSEKRYKYLSSPYNSYQNQDCLHVDKPHQGFGEYRPPYSHASCVIHCLTNRTQSLCGCIIESLHHDNSSVFCTVAKRHSCALDIWDSYFNNASSDFSDCIKPCLEIKYDYELSSVLFRPRKLLTSITDYSSLIYVTISFKDTAVTTTSHEPEFDFGDIISQLGGYMGFCVGASVLTLVELIEAVLKSLKAARLHRYLLVNMSKETKPNPV